MKLIYKAALLICSSVFAMSVQAAGMPQSSKHAQRGVNCTQCHTKNRPSQLHFAHEESEDRRSQGTPRQNQSS